MDRQVASALPQKLTVSLLLQAVLSLGDKRAGEIFSAIKKHLEELVSTRKIHNQVVLEFKRLWKQPETDQRGGCTMTDAEQNFLDRIGKKKSAEVPLVIGAELPGGGLSPTIHNYGTTGWYSATLITGKGFEDERGLTQHSILFKEGQLVCYFEGRYLKLENGMVVFFN